MNCPTKNSELLQRIATYSAVAGASIAGSAPAMAETVSVDAGVTGTYAAPDNQCINTNLDLDGDSNDDFELTVCDRDIGTSFIQFDSLEAPSGYDNLIARTFCTTTTNNTDYGATNVAPGTSIPGAIGSWAGEYGLDLWREAEEYEPCNNFAEGEQGIIAFRLCDGGEFEFCDDTRYGYLNVSWNRGSTILTILGGEYETSANTPITARAIAGPTAVPVGGAIPLSIGLLALGAAALRRRRKHNGH